MTSCLGGCEMFGSVTCALRHFAMYVLVVREWIYLVDVCVAPGYLLLLEKTYVLKNQVKMKRDIVFLARKTYSIP